MNRVWGSDKVCKFYKKNVFIEKLLWDQTVVTNLIPVTGTEGWKWN